VQKYGSLYVSAVPSCAISLLTNYLKLFRIKNCSVPVELRAGISELDERIRIGYLDCFLLIVTEYRNVLFNHNWATPLPKPAGGGGVYDEQTIGFALALHIEWLSSVANDCQQILDRHIQTCVEIDFDDDVDSSAFPSSSTQSLEEFHRHGPGRGHASRKNSINMKPQNTMELNTSMYKLTKLLASVIGTAIDSLSCIIFKSILEFLPTSQIFPKWQLHVLNQNEVHLVEELLKAIDSYLEEDFICATATAAAIAAAGGGGAGGGSGGSGNKNSLEFRCLERLIDICLKKVTVWYLNLLRECSNNSSSLTDDHIAQITQDCILISEYFQTKIFDIKNMITSNHTNTSNGTSSGGVTKQILKFQKIEND
jgi:hypothetical protein